MQTGRYEEGSLAERSRLGSPGHAPRNSSAVTLKDVRMSRRPISSLQAGSGRGQTQAGLSEDGGFTQGCCTKGGIQRLGVLFQKGCKNSAMEGLLSPRVNVEVNLASQFYGPNFGF